MLSFRVRSLVPFTPHRVIIASAYLEAESVQLIGDGRHYHLDRVRRPGFGGGGVHLNVIDAHEAQSFEASLVATHPGSVAAIGYVEMPERARAREDECTLDVCSDDYDELGDDADG